jgi:uncharacterized membrane protein
MDVLLVRVSERYDMMYWKYLKSCFLALFFISMAFLGVSASFEMISQPSDFSVFLGFTLLAFIIFTVLWLVAIFTRR